jgi:hypothetical protein
MKTDQELLEIFNRRVEILKDKTLDETAKREAEQEIVSDLELEDWQRLLVLGDRQVIRSGAYLDQLRALVRDLRVRDMSKVGPLDRRQIGGQTEYRCPKCNQWGPGSDVKVIHDDGTESVLCPSCAEKLLPQLRPLP